MSSTEGQGRRRLQLAPPRVAMAIGLAMPALVASSELPSTPDAYLDQAQRVRRSVDRPWAPVSGQLGNLRRLAIAAQDCVVRLVPGGENRVFPGARAVTVVEESRIFDTDPDEQPAPRDVTLAAEGSDPCPGVGQCGVSIARADAAPVLGGGATCFTVQLASAHEVSVRGEGVDLLVDGLRQPALRIGIGGGYRHRVWFEDVELGLLSINLNAPVELAGSGAVDWLNASSSDRGSAAWLHRFRARNTGVSSTTTHTRWSVRTGPGTWAGYQQPARAPGRLAALYPIEVDGPLDALEVPVGSVSPRPLTPATREAVAALRAEILRRAGPRPAIVAVDPSLPAANLAVRTLPRSAKQRVADVVAALLPGSVRIDTVELWKEGGRIEGTAPDLATAEIVKRTLEASGEFSFAQVTRDRSKLPVRFSVMSGFHCAAPGEPSGCLAADPASPDRYTDAQIRAYVERGLGPSFTIREFRLDGRKVHVAGVAASGSDPRAAFAGFDRNDGTLISSQVIYGGAVPGGSEVRAVLHLQCTAPPRADGICALPSNPH